MTPDAGPDPRGEPAAAAPELRAVGGIAVATPKGRLMGGPETDAFEAAVRGLLERGNRCLVVDLSAVEFMNSIGTGRLIALQVAYKDRGGLMRLAALNERLRYLFAQLSIWPLVFEVHETVDEAMAGFAGRRCPESG